MKVAILGLDGLFPDFSDTFAAQLPNLIRLRREGVTRTLLSTIPPYTPQAWSTLATGVNPGAHGIPGFTLPGGSRQKLVDRRTTCVPRLEEYLTDHGVRIGLLNVPVTFPAPRTDGFAVAGMLTPTTATRGFTWPPRLAGELLNTVPDYAIDTPVKKRDVHDERIWPQLQGMLTQRIKAAHFLLRKKPVDCFFVVFVLLDRVFHLAFRYLDRDDVLFETVRARTARKRLAPLLRALDEFIGDVAERAGRVLVVSDHGFRREEGKFYVNRFLADHGFLRLRRSLKRGIAEVCLRVIGRQRLKRLMPRRLAEREIAATDALVKPDARACAAPLAAQGIVIPDNTVREHLIDLLRGIKDPRGGETLASGIHCREDVYRGNALLRFPDLILELRYGGIEVSPHVIGPDSLYLVSEDWPGGHHDRRGTITVWGSGLPEQSPQPEIPMVDVLPTILHLLEIPQPEALEGRSCFSDRPHGLEATEEP